MAALGHNESEDRRIPAQALEVAVLDRTRSQPRKFSRLSPARIEQVLAHLSPEPPTSSASDDEPPIAP